MPELILLLLVAGAIVFIGLAASFAWEALHPRRRTTAYAIARGLAADPEEVGWSREAWTLDRPDGARLPVWEITGAGGDGAPVVIMLHGWGESKIDSLARAQAWFGIASKVVLYDLRGHGEAEGSVSLLGDGEEDDLLALIERLRAPRLILFGHSLGATIALFAAAKLAEQATARGEESLTKVEAVVAVAPYRVVHTPIRNRLRMLHLPGRPATDGTMAMLRLFGVRQRDVVMAAKRVESRVIVAHGARDQIAPIDDGRVIAEAAPNGELHTINDADHFTILQSSETLTHLAHRATT